MVDGSNLLVESFMKYTFFVVIVFFASVFSSTAQTNAESSELKEAEQLSAQAVKLYQSGKFREALPLAERALILRESALGSDNELVAESLRNLADLQFATKKNKDAESTYDRYLSVYEKTVGRTSPKFTNALERYVCMLVGIDRRAKALEAQKRLYLLENKMEYDDSDKTPTQSLEMAGLMIGKVVNLPRPTYLAEAKQAGISGSVVFKITVDENGKVIDVRTLCGHPLLVKGAEPSMQAARYKPTMVSGRPVKVYGIAIYNFVN